MNNIYIINILATYRVVHMISAFSCILSLHIHFSKFSFSRRIPRPLSLSLGVGTAAAAVAAGDTANRPWGHLYMTITDCPVQPYKLTSLLDKDTKSAAN